MKRNLKRALAFVSAMAMLAPFADLKSNPSVIKASAEEASSVSDASKFGTLELFDSCKGTIKYDGDDGKVTATLSTLTYAPISTTGDKRYTEGYWFGVKIKAPSSVNTALNGSINRPTTINYQMYNNKTGEWRTPGNFVDDEDNKVYSDGQVHWMGYWGLANYGTVADANGNLTYKIRFNWDNSTETDEDKQYEQEFDIVLPKSTLKYTAIPNSSAGAPIITNYTNRGLGYTAYAKYTPAVPGANDGDPNISEANTTLYCGLTTKGGSGAEANNIVSKLSGENVYGVEAAKDSKIVIESGKVLDHTPNGVKYENVPAADAGAGIEGDGRIDDIVKDFNSKIKYGYSATLKPETGYTLPSAITVKVQHTGDNGVTWDDDATLDLFDHYTYSSETGAFQLLPAAFKTGMCDTKGQRILIDGSAATTTKYGRVSQNSGTLEATYSKDNQTIEAKISSASLSNVVGYNDVVATNSEYGEGYVADVDVIVPTVGELSKINKFTINGKEYSKSVISSGKVTLRTLVTNEMIQNAKIAGTDVTEKYVIDWNNDKTPDLTVNVAIDKDSTTLATTNLGNANHICGEYRKGTAVGLGYAVAANNSIVCKTCGQTLPNTLCRTLVARESDPEGSTYELNYCSAKASIEDKTTNKIAFDYVIKLIPDDSSYRLPETVTVTGTSKLTAGVDYVYDKTAGTITISSDVIASKSSSNITVNATCTPESQLKEASVSVAGDIGFNFYATLGTGEKASDYALEIKYKGDPEYKSFTDAKYDAEEKTYRFTLPIAAKEMTDIATIKIVKGADHVASGKAVKVSVKDYAEKLLKAINKGVIVDTEEHELETLIHRMLNYGAATQAYFGYNEQVYADANLDYIWTNRNALAEGTGALTQSATAKSIGTGSYVNTLTAAVPTIDAKNTITGSELTGLKIDSAKMYLGPKTSLRYYFVLSGSTIDKYTFELSFNGKTAKATPVKEKGGYYIEVSSIPAQLLSSMISLKVSDGKNSVVYNSCGNAYGASVLKDATQDDSLKLLVRTLYLYSVAAKDYKTATSNK